MATKGRKGSKASKSCKTKPVKVRSYCRKKRGTYPARNKDGTFKKSKPRKAPARKPGVKKVKASGTRSKGSGAVGEIGKVAKKVVRGTQVGLF